MAKIKALVPELNPDDATKIAAILRLAFGESASSPPAGALEGELTEEMRYAFGLYTKIDSFKMAANLDDVLATLEQVVPLSDEIREKLVAILQLALAEAEKMDDEESLDDEEEEPPDEDFDEEDETMPDESSIRAVVAKAVYSVMGDDDPTPRRRQPRKSASRPAYNFTPSNQDGDPPLHPQAALNEIRFGQMEAPMKTITKDLYGTDYDQKRFNQRAAFGMYIRHGKEALDTNAVRSLKHVILTPTQIKSLVLSGASIAGIKTDMAEVIDDLGGFLVPEDFRTDMISRLPGMTVIRQRAEVVPTGSDMMVRVKITGGNDRYTSAVRVTWVGDIPEDASADTNPTFGVERTPIHICKATVHVPMMLMEDTPFPLVNKINEWVAEAYAIDEDEQFLVGNGIAKPEGILPDQANTNGLTEANSGSASTLTFDGLIDLQYALGQQYWARAVWIMNRATAKVARKLKDGEGAYLWEPNTQVGQPSNLLGYPVLMSEAMPDIAANAYPLIYSDVTALFQIADRVGMSVIRDDITRAEEDMVKFVFRRRLGAQVKAEWAGVVQKISV